jgi:autotransporter-associated beta strand protein
MGHVFSAHPNAFRVFYLFLLLAHLFNQLLLHSNLIVSLQRTFGSAKNFARRLAESLRNALLPPDPVPPRPDSFSPALTSAALPTPSFPPPPASGSPLPHVLPPARTRRTNPFGLILLPIRLRIAPILTGEPILHRCLTYATLDTGSSGAQSVSFALPGANTYNLGGLAGSDALNLGANNLSIGEQGGNFSFTGDLIGTGSVFKRGGGTFTMSGASAFTGGVTVQQAGTLVIPSVANIGTAQPLGAGSSPVALNLGTLVITGAGPHSTNRGLALGNNTNTLQVDGTVSMSGEITGGGSSATFTKSGAGTFNQSGAGSWNSDVNVTAGTYNVTSTGSISRGGGWWAFRAARP